MDMAETRTLAIEGMTCASCSARVERALAKVPGVQAASVNLATEQASVTLIGSATSALLAAVERAGYHAHEVRADEDGAVDADADAASGQRLRREGRAVALAALLTAPLLLPMLGAASVSYTHLTLPTILRV